MTLRAVDCQGFAGGFTLGMVQAGFTLVGKREMQGGFGVANCEANRHLLGDGWRSEAVDPSQWSTVDADVVFGNPPCSGFSVMSAKTFRGAGSKINHCMWAFAEYAARVRPQIAVFESVQIARTSSDGLELMRALRSKVEELTGENWTLYHVRHNAQHVGGAAERRRYFWLISRVPFGVEPYEFTWRPTLQDVIADLTDLEQRWDAQPYVEKPSWWAAPRLSPSGYVDGHIGLSNPLVRRMQDLMAEIEWPPGAAIGAAARIYYEKYGKLPDSWAGMQDKIIANDFNMGFTTPTRWHADRPARVITGGGLHNVIHPARNRTVTHREVARIMGFPDEWLINSIQHVPGLNMTWGKGITVDCGRWVGRWIKNSLNGEPGSYIGEPMEEREFDIDLTYGTPRIPKPPRRLPGIVTRVADKQRQPRPPRETSMTDENTTEARGRGRPRPEATIDRDTKTIEIISAAGETGLTRAEVADKLGLGGGQAYLSLYRLARSETPKIVKRGNRWVAVDQAAAAPTTPADATPMPEFTG